MKKRRKLGKAEEKGTKRQSVAIKTGSFWKELSGTSKSVRRITQATVGSTTGKRQERD